MSTNSTVAETSVVQLKTPKDWPRWLALIKTKAVQKGVWDNVNPDIHQPIVLEEPAAPEPKNGSGQEVPIHTLKSAELEAYKIDRDDWKAKKKLIDKKKEVLQEI